MRARAGIRGADAPNRLPDVNAAAALLAVPAPVPLSGGGAGDAVEADSASAAAGAKKPGPNRKPRRKASADPRRRMVQVGGTQARAAGPAAEGLRYYPAHHLQRRRGRPTTTTLLKGLAVGRVEGSPGSA
jgi:hypothetical protein